jgi:AcrR family transcriptional regulator
MEGEKYLRVLEAARTVFLRYGYRRVTMQDIADEAGISRPALYLVLPNKEEVFRAAMKQLTAESMAAIRAGLPALPDVEERLRFTFEIWTVQPFQLMLSSPDAKDLVHCGQDFASDILNQVAVEFEALLVEILTPLLDDGQSSVLPLTEIAHLLSASIHGYKEAAESVEQLRKMIHGLISLTLAALKPPHAS